MSLAFYAEIYNSLLRVLSTLSGVLGAVGVVPGKATAIGGHNGIDNVLELPDAR
jgi:predicted ATP-dependent serine protease